MGIRITPGQKVTGDDFFDREALIDRLWSQLPGQSIEMVAPRRFGKTSIMQKLVDEPRHGCLVYFLDCEDLRHPSAFVDELSAILCDPRAQARARRAFRRGVSAVASAAWRLRGVTVGNGRVGLKLADAESPTWTAVIDEMMQGARRRGQDMVVIADEFSMMLENFVRSGVEEPLIVNFLSWFRRLRAAAVTDPRVAFVVGGSMSLEYWLRRLNATATMNDLHRVLVEPFNEPTAEEFVAELWRGEGIAWSEEAPARLLHHVAPPVPYWLQVVAWFVLQAVGRGRPITTADVDRAYDDQLLGNAGRHYFQPYEERLARESPDIARGIRAVLAHLAAVPFGQALPRTALLATFAGISGVVDPEVFDRVLADLRSEFYVDYDSDADECRFAFKVLRDWWLRWHPGIARDLTR